MSGKKFRFSLESVLTLREYETEQACQELGVTLEECKKQEETVVKTREAVTGAVREMPTGGAVRPALLRRFDAHRQDARQHHEQACRRLEHLKSREAQARAAVRDRHGAEASLQRLREREQTLHQKEQDDAERAFLDEQATFGFRRRAKQAPLI